MKGKKEFANKLPEILKYKPKQFWGMLKHKAQAADNIDVKKFAEFNSKLFYDEKLLQDDY